MVAFAMIYMSPSPLGANKGCIVMPGGTASGMRTSWRLHWSRAKYAADGVN
jgi:hypothetical protein